jgi:hypothetical protein
MRRSPPLTNTKPLSNELLSSTADTSSAEDGILKFYYGTGPDHRGRTLSKILRKPDRWLEETHDYIQWLFPLYVRSKFNPHAPLLTDEVRAAFTDPAGADYVLLQQNFSHAIYRMLIFYGYSFSPLAPDVVSPTGEWADKSQNWLTDGNHNFMRITRMLRSMTLLGRQELALSFHSVVAAAARAHPKIISTRTLSFWAGAIKSPDTTIAQSLDT